MIVEERVAGGPDFPDHLLFVSVTLALAGVAVIHLGEKVVRLQAQRPSFGLIDVGEVARHFAAQDAAYLGLQQPRRQDDRDAITVTVQPRGLALNQARHLLRLRLCAAQVSDNSCWLALGMDPPNALHPGSDVLPGHIELPEALGLSADQAKRPID